jgi:hypothetical protein
LDSAKLKMPELAHGTCLDAWQAASFKHETWEMDAQTNQPKRLPELTEVTGKQERLPIADGKLSVKVVKRDFRVLTGP